MNFPKFESLEALEAVFIPWADGVIKEWEILAKRVQTPRAEEVQFWRAEKWAADDAQMWAHLHKAEAENYENQALGLATHLGLTVVQAKARCAQMIFVHSKIKNLANAAESRLMSVQSDLKNLA